MSAERVDDALAALSSALREGRMDALDSHADALSALVAEIERAGATLPDAVRRRLASTRAMIGAALAGMRDARGTGAGRTYGPDGLRAVAAAARFDRRG